MIDSDVIIVGGGPAGSACARLLHDQGLQTMILDKKTFPRHKTCAGWITPRVLHDLDIKESEYPYSMLTFRRLNFHVYGIKVPVKTRQYSIRRYEFDYWLIKRAGVSVRQHTVKDIQRVKDYYIIDDKFRCRYLVGAGGTNCPVYKRFFRSEYPRGKGQLIIAMEEEFEHDYNDTDCHLWFFENGLPGYSWYVPKGDGYVNVGIGGKLYSIRDRGESISTHWNYFVRKLEGLSLVKGHSCRPHTYSYYLGQNIYSGQVGNVFIVGDAVGLATFDMGEGIGPSIQSGILATRSIISGEGYSLKTVTKYSIPIYYSVRYVFFKDFTLET